MAKLERLAECEAMVEDNISTNGWWQRVESKKAVALAMRDDRKHAREAWSASGSAIEFALKAVISKKMRYNRWPDDKDHRTHNIRKLMTLAGIDREKLPKDLRAKFALAAQWDRNHDYNAKRMPRKIARDMFRAAFDNGGIVPWLKTL